MKATNDDLEWARAAVARMLGRCRLAVACELERLARELRRSAI